MLPACAVETSGILSGPTDDDLKWPWPWLWKNVAWNFDELSGSLLCLSSLCDQWDSGYGPRIRSVRTWIAVELPAAVGHVIRRGGRGAKGYPGFPAALGKMSSLSKSRPTWPGWPGWTDAVHLGRYPSVIKHGWEIPEKWRFGWEDHP